MHVHCIGAKHYTTMRRHDVHQQQKHTSQLRLKCIILGSANAGKTSLLRRYIHGTFEGHGNSITNRRRGRSTNSTLGADYYVKKAVINGNDVFVQLWDTAGKERSEGYPAQYDKKSNFYQFLSIRPSSTNSTNYEHRYNNWGFINGISKEQHHERSNGRKNNTPEGTKQKGKVRLQNSQLKHGHFLHYHHHNNFNHSPLHSNEPTDGALFRNIDACMLVYDAT